jgi:hypothetical protein
MRGRTLLRLLVTLLLVAYPALGSDCDGDGDDDDHSQPNGKVTGLRAGPKEVQLVPPAPGKAQSFRLFAWYLDGDSIVPGRNDPMDWQVPTSDGTHDKDGQVTIHNFPATGSAQTLVRVFKQSEQSIADQVKVTRWASVTDAAAGGSVVKSDHTPGKVPSLALVEEHQKNLPCRWGQPRAFAGAAAVGPQTDNPCSVSVFSADQAMSFEDNSGGTRWSANAWTSTAAPHATPSAQPLTLKITVFLAATNAGPAGPAVGQPPSNAPGTPAVSAADLAQADVAWANTLYEDNRIGVKIEVAKYVPVQPTNDLPSRMGADPFDCALPHGLPSNSTALDYAYEPSHVSVYYVDRINFPPEPEAPRVRGVQCHYWYSGNPAGTPPGQGPVVYVSTSHHSSTTLAHELGHALGLNDEELLGALNIMNGILPDGPQGAEARSRLTVGQAFRMNVWNDSWINTRLPRPTQRTCYGTQQCPLMGWDVP